MMRFKSLLILFLAVAFMLNGCQEELVEFIEPREDQVLTTNSPVADLVKRMALLDGSSDNIIDHSSCTSIVLPVSVIVYGHEMTVYSEEDFNTIKIIFDESDEEEKDLKIIFPINVILADYSLLLIHNEDELEDLIEECTEGGDDIECVDFHYPLQFSAYDADNQVSRVIRVNNDKELFLFFDQLNEDMYVSFNFPVRLRRSDGKEVHVNDNDELQDIIEDSMDGCNEDDDNDPNDDNIDNSTLNAFLTSGEWEITYYFDGDNESDAFNGIAFSFNEDGSILASDGIETVEGEWETNGNGDVMELELDFDSVDPFHAIDDEWEVTAYTEKTINLKESGGGNDPVEVLVLEKK